MISVVYFLNALIPFFFFEFAHILIALFAIVLIESVVVRLFVNADFRKVIRSLMAANSLSTIVGFICQVIFRIIILLFSEGITGGVENEIFHGIVGNVSIATKDKETVFASLATTMILMYLISIFVERYFLYKDFSNLTTKMKLLAIVILANTISYLLLGWLIYFDYLKFLT